MGPVPVFLSSSFVGSHLEYFCRVAFRLIFIQIILYSITQLSIVQYNNYIVQYIIVQYSIVQQRKLQYGVAQYGIVQCSKLWCSIFNCSVVQCRIAWHGEAYSLFEPRVEQFCRAAIWRTLIQIIKYSMTQLSIVQYIKL